MELVDHTLTFQRANPDIATGVMQFYDPIQGDGSLVITGVQVAFFGPNTFTGSVTVEDAGVVNLQNKFGLGTTAGLTTLKSGGTLSIGDRPAFLDSLSESITLDGGTVELEQLGFNGDPPAPLPFYG